MYPSRMDQLASQHMSDLRRSARLAALAAGCRDTGPDVTPGRQPVPGRQPAPPRSPASNTRSPIRHRAGWALVELGLRLARS